MARTVRDARLETRTARQKLAIRAMAPQLGISRPSNVEALTKSASAAGKPWAAL